jgi:hypothetical protein
MGVFPNEKVAARTYRGTQQQGKCSKSADGDGKRDAEGKEKHCGKDGERMPGQVGLGGEKGLEETEGGDEDAVALRACGGEMDGEQGMELRRDEGEEDGGGKQRAG